MLLFSTVRLFSVLVLIARVFVVADFLVASGDKPPSPTLMYGGAGRLHNENLELSNLEYYNLV